MGWPGLRSGTRSRDEETRICLNGNSTAIVYIRCNFVSVFFFLLSKWTREGCE